MPLFTRTLERSAQLAVLDQQIQELELRNFALTATLRELVQAIETAPQSTYLSTEALAGMFRKAAAVNGSGVDVLAAPHTTWRPLREALDKAARLLGRAR